MAKCSTRFQYYLLLNIIKNTSHQKSYCFTDTKIMFWVCITHFLWSSALLGAARSSQRRLGAERTETRILLHFKPRGVSPYSIRGHWCFSLIHSALTLLFRYMDSVHMYVYSLSQRKIFCSMHWGFVLLSHGHWCGKKKTFVGLHNKVLLIL